MTTMTTMTMRPPLRTIAIVLTALTLSLTACKRAPTPATRLRQQRPHHRRGRLHLRLPPSSSWTPPRARITNVPRPTGAGLAPVNQFGTMRSFPDDTFTDVVSPNADTLYSSAFLDLAKEPIVLSVPDTHGQLLPHAHARRLDQRLRLPRQAHHRHPQGRLSSSPARSGPAPRPPACSRSNPPPTWSGSSAAPRPTSPPTSPPSTPSRASTNSPTLRLGQALHPTLEHRHRPRRQQEDLTRRHHRGHGSLRLLQPSRHLHAGDPPAPADAPRIEQLATIGVVPGQPFDINKSGPAVARAIDAGFEDGKKRLVELGTHPINASTVNGWMLAIHDIGAYGTHYGIRAGTAWYGLGANLPDDAIYPVARTDADGNPLSGSHTYVIHFDKGQTPPVNAFWSLTMYKRPTELRRQSHPTLRHRRPRPTEAQPRRLARPLPPARLPRQRQRVQLAPRRRRPLQRHPASLLAQTHRPHRSLEPTAHPKNRQKLATPNDPSTAVVFAVASLVVIPEGNLLSPHSPPTLPRHPNPTPTRRHPERAKRVEGPAVPRTRHRTPFTHHRSQATTTRKTNTPPGVSSQLSEPGPQNGGPEDHSPRITTTYVPGLDQAPPHARPRVPRRAASLPRAGPEPTRLRRHPHSLQRRHPHLLAPGRQHRLRRHPPRHQLQRPRRHRDRHPSSTPSASSAARRTSTSRSPTPSATSAARSTTPSRPSTAPASPRPPCASPSISSARPP